MKLSYILVLAGFVALSVSAKSVAECKFAVNKLTKSLDFPVFSNNNGKLDTRPIHTVIAFKEMSLSVNRLSKDLVDKCSGVEKEIKRDQYLRFAYLDVLERIKDTYTSIWAASDHIKKDINVYHSVESLLKDLDYVIDFIYTWPGTYKENNYKRLVNDIIRLRVDTKAALL